MKRKKRCNSCGIKLSGKYCKIDGLYMCKVCSEDIIKEKKYKECLYFGEQKKQKVDNTFRKSSKLGSIFGGPQMQKAIMETSIDLMNNHSAIGDRYDKDAENYRNESFAFFNTEEFANFSFTVEEIEQIIKELGKPGDTQEWFFSEEGVAYYTKAVELIVDENRFKTFSQELFKILLAYYQKEDFEKSWLILSTVNRLMENDFVIPFTILMFFKGLAAWKQNNTK